ncbi:hypothetical protein ACFSC4_21115 [Deinococcus malanensis]|uniref:hypothetical protein n=1 Tax=Deinococcus malanensis TaxID=1706855 RepID=UPI003636695D
MVADGGLAEAEGLADGAGEAFSAASGFLDAQKEFENLLACGVGKGAEDIVVDGRAHVINVHLNRHLSILIGIDA